ncbi:MAG: HEAT repeat domain-containing protein [Chloroflexota bacterium]
MLSLDAMKKLREAYNPHRPEVEQEILEELGHPNREEIVETALNGMESNDRNVRVLMLRVLGGQSGEKALQGILAGLQDEKRRVRFVALQSCASYLHFPEVAKLLESMITNESEKRNIRQGALMYLANGAGEGGGIYSETAVEAIKDLYLSEEYRKRILFGLVQVELTKQVENLLKMFVELGSKDEAVMATKALCGYYVVHIDGYSDEARKQITQTCELALPRMHYWIQRGAFTEHRIRNLIPT